MKIGQLIKSSISRAIVLSLLTRVVNYFEQDESTGGSTKKVADKLPAVATTLGMLSPVLPNKKILLYGSVVLVIAGLVAGAITHSAGEEKSPSL